MQKDDSPHELILEFYRTKESGDPFGFEFAAQTYLLRQQGGGVENATFLWDSTVLADLVALQRPTTNRAARQRLGEVLRRFLNQAGWEKHEEQIERALAQGQKVHLTIRSAAAELYALPWELLATKATGQHLAELPGVLLRYEWPDTYTAARVPDPPPAPGRILVAWSAAGGEVPAREQLEVVRHACRAGHLPFIDEVSVLGHSSLSGLHHALAAPGPPVSVLHILCHGGAFGEQARSYGLIWDGPDGTGPVHIDAAMLRQALAPYSGSLRLVVICACQGGDAGAPDSRLGSVAQALHRVGIPAIVASRQPLSIADSIALTETLYKSLLVELSSLEDAFLAARIRLVRNGCDSWSALQLYARAADGVDHRPLVFQPYRGLAAFQPAERRFYFGRERDVGHLVDQLRGGKRLLTVVGPSGSGKSSLVLAGVVPAVLDAALGDGPVQVRVMRPGSTPCTALAAALSSAGAEDGTLPLLTSTTAAELAQNLLCRQEALAALLGEAAPASRLLLVVDQFEELFTQANRRQAEALIDNLLYATAQPHGSLAVVLTLRADFLGQCLSHAALAERVRSSMEVVLPLGERELRSTITRPAALAGLQLEEGLVESLIEALRDSGVSSDSHDEAASAGRTAALPILQFALEQLWVHRRGQLLTWEAWRAMGGLHGAIARRANEVLAIATHAGERDLVRQLFGRLVQLGEATVDTRRRALWAELESLAPDHAKRVLNRWIEARLLTADAVEVTIAHEALLHEWGTLRGWIDESRESLRLLQHLSRDVRRYQAGGNSEDDLWRGTPLRRALALQAAERLPASAEESAFLRESAAAAKRQQELVEQQRRRDRDDDVSFAKRSRTIAIVSLLILIVTGNAWAMLNVSRLTHEVVMLYMASLGGLATIGVLALRKSLLANEFNRHWTILQIIGVLPVFVNHWVASLLSEHLLPTLIRDLMLLNTIVVTAAITVDRVLWGLAVVYAGSIVVMLRWPNWSLWVLTFVIVVSVPYFLFMLHHRSLTQRR